MSQYYSDPSREAEPYALSDVEVFEVYPDEIVPDSRYWPEGEEEEDVDADELSGWYYWPCFPGCLPDSDPIGPYKTESEALEAARDE